MSYLLQVDFPYSGPWAAEMTSQMINLANDISGEIGLIWKIWTENPATQKAGGIYLFDSEENALRYLSKHQKRLKEYGIPMLNHQIFLVNTNLSKITHAQL